MDYKYLLLRYQTFRDEYLEHTHKWLRTSCSWLWHITIDNFKFLYQGEISQFRLLKNTLRQKNEYIELISSAGSTVDTARHGLKARQDNFLADWILLVVRVCLLPLSFLVYWIRRILRMITQRQYDMVISEFRSVSDIKAERFYLGTAQSIYLAPANYNHWPSGLILFRYTLEIYEGIPDTILFIDPGVGINREYTIPIPYTPTRQTELLLELPPHCDTLQLQIIAGAGRFSLKDVSMTEIHLLQAARYLKNRYDFDLDDILHTLYIRKLPGVRRILASKLSYPEWQNKYTQLSNLDYKAIKAHIAILPNPPLLSLVISVSNHRPDLLELSLQSVHNQLYPYWELLVFCSEPMDAHTTTILNRFERYDERIKIIISTSPAGITCNPADAVSAATGQLTAILDQGDLLTEHALYLFACKLHEQPHARLLYSDHDHIDEHGRLSDPCLKPDWNYDFLLGKNYLQNIVFYHTDDLKRLITGQQPVIEPYQLNLQMIESMSAEHIVHIPYILLHHRTAAGSMIPTGPSIAHKAILDEHLLRSGQTAIVKPGRAGFRVMRSIPEVQPLVSLIVLTRDRVALLSNCISGLLANTAWKNFELIIIDNGSVEASTLTYLEAICNDNRVRVYQHPGEFNFSALNNFAVDQAKGEYLGLLNNDISVIRPDWMEEMMSHLLRPEVGIVGAKLLYENETIQHAGVIIGLGGVAGHGFRHAPRNYHGYDDRLLLTQQLSCVTAACLFTKKSIYQAVGGLDEVSLRIAFNDVDYCLKVRQQGWKVIWTPFAELYHLESASRGHDLSKENIARWKSEYNFMRNKWREVLEYDPYYNPNLAITDEEFTLAQPPRLLHPWESYKYIQSTRFNLQKA